MLSTTLRQFRNGDGIAAPGTFRVTQPWSPGRATRYAGIPHHEVFQTT
jgi:hypothetical protein